MAGRPRRGRYGSLIMRGGSVLPALTPRSPPQPSSAQRVGVEHLDLEASLRADDAAATSAMPAGGEVAGRRVGEVAGELRGAGDRPRPRPAPRSTGAARVRAGDERELAAAPAAGASRFSAP